MCGLVRVNGPSNDKVNMRAVKRGVGEGSRLM